MKAIQFRAFGGPDALEHVERQAAPLGPGFARVQVHSASVNPSDVKNTTGHFHNTVLPRIPGRDFSGIVVEGPAEWLGAAVWGTGGDIGFTLDGSHAESIVLPVAALVRKPNNLSHEQAAAIGVNFVVAWLGTVDYAKLSAGETIAVIGSSGGVGGAVVQIAKSLGCRVVAVDRNAPVAGSPASRLIDQHVSLADTEAQRALGGVDVVYDTVGGIAFESALGLVKRRGRVLQISATGKRRVDFDLIDFYHNETQLMGVDSAKLGVVESAPIMQALVPGFEAGRFSTPLIAERYPLAQAAEAYRAVARGTRGRVVINPVL